MTCQNIRDQLLDKVLSSIQYYPLVGDTSNIFEQISNSKLCTRAQASNVVGSCTASTMQLGPKRIVIEGSVTWHKSLQAVVDLAHTLFERYDVSRMHPGSSNHSPPVLITGASGPMMENNQGQQFETGKAASKRKKDCGVQAKCVHDICRMIFRFVANVVRVLANGERFKLLINLCHLFIGTFC